MKAYGLTHCGMVRKENQDSFEILELSDKALICVVCDGMGGANAGALAGSLACNTFVQYLKVHLKSASQMKKLMLKAVEEANRAVYEKAATDPSYRGMGRTLTAIGIWDKDVCVVNVGDSRVYAVGEAGIECLTVDHSVVELMVQRGEITSEQAKHYPGKNMITRAVGTDASVQSDVFTRQHTQGDAAHTEGEFASRAVGGTDDGALVEGQKAVFFGFPLRACLFDLFGLFTFFCVVSEVGLLGITLHAVHLLRWR